MRAVVLLAGAVCLLVAPVRATPLQDKIAALRDAIKAEDASAAKSGPTPAAGTMTPGFRGEMLEANLDQFLSQTNQYGGASNASAIINQILSTYSSEAVQKAGAALLDEIQAEQKAKEDAYTAGVQEILTRLKNAVATSGKPSDLDPILVDLQKYQNRAGVYPDEQTQQLTQQVQQAYQFATSWQDYLAAKANGQMDQAGNDLRNLAMNGYGISIMPRSEILAREQDLLSAKIGPGNATGTTPAEIIAGIKSLDDMQPALDRINALGAGTMNQNYTPAVQTLRTFVSMYERVKSGLPTTLNLNAFYSNDSLGNAAMESKLLLFVLRNYFPSYQGPAPGESKTPTAFVDDVIVDAQTRQDWQQLREAIGVKMNMNQMGGGSMGGFVQNPMDSFIAAQNQEIAGQYAQAVNSYEMVLKIASPYVPAKVIGERLAAIQKDHPAEYAQGQQLAASPPVSPAVYRVIQGYPYGYPGNPAFVPGVNSTLAMPGRTLTSPVAAPIPAGGSTNAAPVVPAPAPAKTNPAPAATE